MSFENGKEVRQGVSQCVCNSSIGHDCRAENEEVRGEEAGIFAKSDLDISIGAAGDNDSAAYFGESEHDEHDKNAAYGVGEDTGCSQLFGNNCR